MARPVYIVPRPSPIGTALKWALIAGAVLYLLGQLLALLLKLAVIAVGIIIVVGAVRWLLGMTLRDRSSQSFRLLTDRRDPR